MWPVQYHSNIPFIISQELKPVNHSSHSEGSSVLMLFHYQRSKISLTLTKRSTLVTTHKGQMCFPGGRVHIGKESPAQAALRETEEELGITQSQVTLIGELPPLQGINGQSISIFLGITSFPTKHMQFNQQEVTAICMVPWQKLTQEHAKCFQFNLFGIRRHSFLYQFNGYNIWGLTANMIYSSQITAK